MTTNFTKELNGLVQDYAQAFQNGNLQLANKVLASIQRLCDKEVGEALPKTDNKCYICGNPLYRIDNRLQCAAAGCGGWELQSPATAEDGKEKE